MPRKLAFVAALFMCLTAPSAFAVGLGEITLHSALNQKLDAEIELIEVGGLDPAEILASLASSDDFTRVGVERFFYLTSLRFAVEMRGGGRAIVKVTSAQPITEPYLNFLVQVLWPNGRLLKEYTLLLDPPAFADQAPPPTISPPRSDPGGGPAGKVERIPTRPDSQVSLSPSSDPRPAPEDRLREDSYGMTDRDDTLWAIALKTRPSSRVSVQQHMLAIERLNPNAFIGGNINLLKAGFVLKLPSEDQAGEITSAQANEQVAEHHRQWESYRAGQPLQSVADAAGTTPPADTDAEAPPLAGQVDATARGTTDAPSTPGTDGELRIVAGEGGTGTASGTGDAAENTEGRMVAAEEERDRISRENDELVYRIDKMTGELEQTQRQIEVRDQQIAQLQERLGQLEKQGAAATAAAPSGTAGKTASWTDWLQSPAVLIGVLVVVVGGVVWALIAARTRRAREDRSADVYAEVRPARAPRQRATPVASAVVPESMADAPLDDEGDDATVIAAVSRRDAAPVRQATDEDAVPGAQTSDVIGEADIYIAYGRFPQAIGLLLGALEDDQSRSDVRLKLLELYTETRDDEGFAVQMAELVKRCDDETILLEARALESKLRDEDSTRERAPAGQVAAEEDTRGLDEFSLDLQADEPPAPPPPAPSAPRVTASGGAGDELGGDLGIDFNPDKEPTVVRARAGSGRPAPRPAARSPAAESVVEFDLEDLELDKEPIANAPASGKTAQADGDDAFDFLDEEDAASTKLDLARAYIEMGDQDGARDILSEVLQEGTREQQQQANELLEKLS